MFYGSGIYFGSRLLGRSTAFWPLCILALIVLFSIFDQGRGLHRIFLGSWHGIPNILMIATALALLLYLERHMQRVTQAEQHDELAESEAQFVSANRPGGWKQYYGMEDDTPKDADISEEIRRHGWQPSFGPNCDLLASTARRHREEQAQLLQRKSISALLHEDWKQPQKDEI